MPKFFIDGLEHGSGVYTLPKEEAAHAVKSLRMTVGDEIILCDGKGTDYICELTGIAETVTAQLKHTEKSAGEPDIFLTLFMAVPKGDKMDLVVQKATELGAGAVVPVWTRRCVSRPEGKALAKKLARWQKIAEEAAKQCGRGRIPPVEEPLCFADAVCRAARDAMPLFFYEGEQETRLRDVLLQKAFQSVSVLVGPEGGFDAEEYQLAVQAGMKSVSLGSRILRCETAPLAAIAAVMFHSGNF